MVYGVEPDLTREGGSIPVTLTLQVVLLWTLCWLLMGVGCWSLIISDSLIADEDCRCWVWKLQQYQLLCWWQFDIIQEATGKNVILLPMGAADDGAHSQNEKIDIRSGVNPCCTHFHRHISSRSGTTSRGRSCSEHTPISSASSRHVKGGVHIWLLEKYALLHIRNWQSGASTWYLTD